MPEPHSKPVLPYGRQTITEADIAAVVEVLPAIRKCLARVDAIDSALSAAGEELYRQELLAAAFLDSILTKASVEILKRLAEEVDDHGEDTNGSKASVFLRAVYGAR